MQLVPLLIPGHPNCFRFEMQVISALRKSHISTKRNGHLVEFLPGDLTSLTS